MLKGAWILVCLVMIVGCAKDIPKPVSPAELPVVTEAENVTKMPVYLPKVGGKVLSLELDEPAPFAGILLSESKAVNVGQLRIAYDEVYSLYRVDRLFFLRVIAFQEKGLYKSDALILKKDKQIDRLQNSWWARHKMTIGIGGGIVVGVAVAILAGRTWAEISTDESGNPQ